MKSHGTDSLPLAAAAWREVGRATDLGEVLERLRASLRDAHHVGGISLWRTEVAARVADCVADAGERAHGAPRRVTWSESALPSLLGWLRGGRPARGATGLGPVEPLLAPAQPHTRALALPLVGARDTLGVALLTRTRGAWTDEEASVLAGLVEPLAHALLHDRQRHELERLREAVEADNRALRSRLGRADIAESIVGADAGMREVIERIDQVAHTDVPVLILGETGTGKEVVARTIHGRSSRKTGPVVCVNCGAIAPGLVDSELFGHERGSFTGAVAARKGWFERADGGTLFLDEVGELPLDAQVRLLRVLQEGVLERVGGAKSIQVNVRVVAATHRNLAEMVREGRFREDLWYRLSVFPVELPPLRERPGDIPALANHFAARAGWRLGGNALAVSSADVDLLVAYDWPGNVRELAAVIERAAILGGGKELAIAAALGVRAVGRASVPPSAGAFTPSSATAHGRGPFPTLDEAMVAHMEAALARTRGKIEGPGGAAELLGLNPHTLRSRMRKHHLNWRRFRTAAGA